ncbi:MAG: transglycosylase SLT domain-containing protein, partial [Methyloceanibacter sp.]|nr:transglycosylase SLT domain-containing protein [Methyloceanibacter sp.]
MRTVSPIAALSAGLILLAPPCEAGEAIAVARVDAGVTEAGLAAAGPKPFVDIVCPIMQQQAEVRGLPPMPFVRLIWRESRFNPQAVSPKGAQGIAQFMPGTASDR